MYIELRHLRTIRAIQQAGGLARAADMLNMTQSALSHQVAGLEAQVGMELFVRRSKPMTLSAAGIRMLRTAERILPEITALEDEFRALQSGKTGRLHIAIQCHACFDWLFPVLELFRHAWPEVDVDIRAGPQGLKSKPYRRIGVVALGQFARISGIVADIGADNLDDLGAVAIAVFHDPLQGEQGACTDL